MYIRWHRWYIWYMLYLIWKISTYGMNVSRFLRNIVNLEIYKKWPKLCIFFEKISPDQISNFENLTWQVGILYNSKWNLKMKLREQGRVEGQYLRKKIGEVYEEKSCELGLRIKTNIFLCSQLLEFLSCLLIVYHIMVFIFF